MKRIYVASSWRNAIQPEIIQVLRQAGHEVYDFRNPAPGQSGFAWLEVNRDWLQWTPEQFARDLYAGHPAVERGFSLDKKALDWCDTCVLVLPCGRSAHLEAGYAAGQGKLTLFYLHPDKFEPELMYLLGHGCVTNTPDLLSSLEAKSERAGSNVSHLLQQVGEPGQCRGCGAPIYWVQHRNGKRAPYTVEGQNHFANCPNAAQFRKTGAGGR